MTSVGLGSSFCIRLTRVGCCTLLLLLGTALAGASTSQAVEPGGDPEPQCMVEPWYCGEEEAPQCMVEPWYCGEEEVPQCMVEPWYCGTPPLPPDPCADSSCAPAAPVDNSPPTESSSFSALTQSPVADNATESKLSCGQGKIRQNRSCGRKCAPDRAIAGTQKRAVRRHCGRRRG